MSGLPDDVCASVEVSHLYLDKFQRAGARLDYARALECTEILAREVDRLRTWARLRHRIQTAAEGASR